jgi:hypothetical protein
VKAWLKRHDVLTMAAALIGAFALWLFIVDTNPTTITRTIYNVPLTVSGEDTLKNRNLVITSDKDLRGTVEVSGTFAEVMAMLSAPDNYGFLSLNLSNITTAGDKDVRTEWRWVGGQPPEISTAHGSSLRLTVEKILDKAVPVSVVTVGDLPLC